MKLRKYFWLVLFLLPNLQLLHLTSCKKEKKNPEQPVTLKLSIDNTSPYVYSIVLIEGNMEIVDFNETITIGDSIVEATVSDKSNIVFVIPPTVNIGQQLLKLKCNGKAFEFTLNIKVLPAITDPKKQITDFLDNSLIASQKLNIALDSFYKRTGLTPDPIALQLQNEGKIMRDSLISVSNELNKLHSDELNVAANIISANSQDIQASMQAMNEIADMFLGNKLARRGNYITCNDAQLNVSSKYQCIFTNITNSINRTMKSMVRKTMRAGALGFGVGLIASALTVNPQPAILGWKAGLSTAFLVLAWENAEAIRQHLNVSLFCFSDAFVIANAELGTRLQAPSVYQNGEKQPVQFLLTMRNIQPEDRTSKIGFVSSFLKTYFEFTELINDFLSRHFPEVPGFQKQYTKVGGIEDMDYLSVSVIDNSKITTSGFEGSKNKLELTFKSTDVKEMDFEYAIDYNDGIMQSKTILQAKLKSEVSITLEDMTIPADSKNIYFDVKAPEFMSWTITYPTNWMIVLPANGAGNGNVTVNVQNNYTGSARSDYIKFKCGTIEIWKKITQTTIKRPKVSFVRNGIDITASGTDGTLPYTYKFLGPGFKNIGKNTATLTYDGYYRVVLIDSNGFSDTAIDSIFTVTIKEVAISSINGPWLRINYESPYGLSPEFLTPEMGTSVQNRALVWHVVSSNNPNYFSESTDPCEPAGGQSILLGVTKNGSTYTAFGPLNVPSSGNYELSIRLATFKRTESVYCPKLRPGYRSYTKTVYSLNYTK